MSNKLHTLLIGIDTYPHPYALEKCTADLENMATYLENIQPHSANTHILEIKKLLNGEATKKAIVNSLKETISKLNDEDTLLFYFNGHGTQELSNGRFKEDHNGLIQCCVCYHEDPDEVDYLLADKEIRYLLNQCNNNAHIVAIFDCCHSGSMTRALGTKGRMKRISQTFPERDYRQFVFHEEVAENEFLEKDFKDIFPDANITSLSACQSNQSAWENEHGGVFTRFLLETLKAHNGYINYNELIRQVDITIRQGTPEKQSPALSIQGSRKYNQLTSWLMLNGNEMKDGADYIKYNNKIGWVYTKGTLMGVKKGSCIHIRLPDTSELEVALEVVNLTDSVTEDLLAVGIELDRGQIYPVTSRPSKIQPVIAINSLDSDTTVASLLESLLKETKTITYGENSLHCDYQMVLFNEQVYLTLANEPFQPLHEPFNLLSDNLLYEQLPQELRAYFLPKIQKVSKWFHWKETDFHDGFINIPIKVEAKANEVSEWVDITNGNLPIKPKQGERKSGLLYNSFSIRVTNTSEETLYVTVLALIYSSHEISAYPFEDHTILLEPKSSKSFHSAIYFDHNLEVYNWEYEKILFKLIVNNHSDITTQIPSMTQNGFLSPMTRGQQKKGGGAITAFEPQLKNAVYTSEVTLLNTSLNQITGILATNADAYANDELISPFIERLYFDISSNGLAYTLKEKPNAEGAKVKGGGFKMNLGNLIDYTRRNRRFRKMRKRFPKKPIIVAEGDSWFLYPILVKDTLDYLMEDWPVKSLAWAGDTLENYKKSGDLLKAVEKLRPTYVLISGGGNDIIGEEILQLLKKDVTDAVGPKDYLNEKYEPQMKMLGDYYTYFFESLEQHAFVNKVLVHGYDYIRTDHAKIVTKGGWLNKHMEKMGILDSGEREVLIKFLIDSFNTLLESLAANYDKVTYLNMRGLIARDEWYDEIHPNDIGYEKVAKRFLEHMN